jgi:zinc transport system substrate-binding protein
VVAGFEPLAEAARRVGGDQVSVTNLTPPGVEPHDMSLTSRQVERIERADLVVYLGKGFQPALEKVVGRSRGTVVDALVGVPPVGSDPHVWLDPRLMAGITEQVGGALARLAPRSSDVFARNGDAYRQELAALDGEYERGLSDCDRRVVVTAHAAFAYLARRYRLEQVAVSGLAPEAEPDPRRLAEVVDLVRRLGVTAVFTEPLVSPKVAETLAREAGARTATLDPFEGLTRAQRARGESYLTVMRANLAALRSALGCR